jgi:hypothetical protein
MLTEVEIPPVQAVGEPEVTGLETGPNGRAGRTAQPGRRTVLGPLLVRRHPVQDLGEHVVAGVRHREPVHHRVSGPERRASSGRHGQAKAETGRDLPGSGRRAEFDPCRGRIGDQPGTGSQPGGTIRGHLDVYPGHRGPGRAEQPGAEFLRDPSRDGDAARRVEQARQGVGARPVAMQQPDRHRAVAGVVGEHDQEPLDQELAVAHLPRPGPDVRDADGDHDVSPGRGRENAGRSVTGCPKSWRVFTLPSVWRPGPCYLIRAGQAQP